jgi:hypothetical protein
MARYSLESVDFGGEVDAQDAYNTVDPQEQDIDGLQRVYLRQFSIQEHAARYVNLPTTGDGEVTDITLDGNDAKRREWNITFRPPIGSTPEFIVTQRRLGTISTVTTSTMEDDAGTYTTDELVGMQFHPREQEQPDLFTIIANTQGSITVQIPSTPSGIPSIMTLAQAGDSYAVETTESVIGKVFKGVLTVAASAGQLNVVIASSIGISAGDLILLRNNLGQTAVREVQSTTPTSLTFTTTVPFAMIVGDSAEYYWQSDDGVVGFVVNAGTSPWAVGDQLYVDVYPQTGDIKLRPENFPLLSEDNLVINTIGGVR